MCTVTVIPSPGKFFITSNRDEKYQRSKSIPPQVYKLTTGKVLFPRDSDAGGTWIAVHENGNAIVLLNGGFVPHLAQPPYRKSRGLILLDLIDSVSAHNTFNRISLERIEPFTVIIREDENLYECVWDGETKHVKQLDRNPQIRSSVTLYSSSIIEKRQRWFAGWIDSSTDVNQDSIIDFHQHTGDGDRTNDLNMDREGQYRTVSVTSMSINDEEVVMVHTDLSTGNVSRQSLAFTKSFAGK
jgi:hypothetical protein